MKKFLGLALLMIAGIALLAMDDTQVQMIGSASDTIDGYVMVVSSRCTMEKVDEITYLESIEIYKAKGIYGKECRI